MQLSVALSSLILLIWAFVVVSSLQSLAAEQYDKECSASDNAEPSSAHCSGVDSETKDFQNQKEKIHLAGFLPDGYFERARGRLGNPATQAYYDFEVRQFQSKKDYQAFLPVHFPGAEIPFSTVVWVENPLEILGNSDDLEKFYTDCIISDNRDVERCSNIRNYFKELRKDNAIQQARVAAGDVGGWEHEAHQGVKCTSLYGIADNAENTFSGSVMPFHIILNRDWNRITFESFSEALKAKTVSEQVVYVPEIGGDVDAIFWGAKPHLKVPSSAELSPQQLSKVFERGTLSTNGTTIRLQLKNRRFSAGSSVADGFMPFGFVPEGDLRRTNELWVESLRNGGQATITTCQFMFGGLRRVQSILAMDRMEAPNDQASE